MLIGGLILLLLITFVQSALILLPWTVGATMVGALAGIGLGRLVGRSRATGALVSVVACFTLTIGLGYLAYALVPPKAPPQKKGLEEIMSMPTPSQDALWGTLPIHLSISAILGSVIVSRLWYSWSPDLTVWTEEQKP